MISLDCPYDLYYYLSKRICLPFRDLYLCLCLSSLDLGLYRDPDDHHGRHDLSPVLDPDHLDLFDHHPFPLDPPFLSDPDPSPPSCLYLCRRPFYPCLCLSCRHPSCRQEVAVRR